MAFNAAVKESSFPNMTKAKDNAKNYYLKFVDLLKCESRSDQSAFKETLNDFSQEIKKMADYIKNN